ncbi:hypothetical protein WME73_46480 [Sorangium sp. So ce302]|uniref:hypothetical protein n=1 Tax=Sorangium sp. So ce302 TaxID=3133297 RepID=UPI003F6084F6
MKLNLLTVAFAASAAVVLLDAQARADCGCSGSPSTLTSDSSGPCLRYEAPSGSSNDITFRFDKAYACGQYATGEYFVISENGVASITTITPEAAGGRHGVDVNPPPDGPQRWDDRLDDHAPPISLPYAAPPGSSVVKYVSDNPSGDCDGAGEKSCGRFAAVVTVIDAPPADPSTTFRPPFVGTNKPVLSTSTLQTQLLSRLQAACADTPSLETAQAWTRHLRLDYTSHSVTCDLMPPEDALPDGRPWSTDIWARDTDVYAWLHLADVCGAPPCTPEEDLAAKFPVLVGYVQHGIDIWGVDRMGASLFRGGGGNGGGKLFAYAFAAAMLADPAMLADLAAVDAGRFFETASYYAGKNGAALWGQPVGTEEEYWDDFSDQSTRTIRDPYGYIDGGFEPGGWYQDNTAKPTKYSALLMRLMPALAAAWPVNKDVLLSYADRWVDHGALTQPDPCAPVGGQYGSDHGPDGSGDCISGSGRVPELDGSNKDGGNRERAMGECMWSSFRGCSETCSCPGQSCGPASQCGDGKIEAPEECDGDDAGSCPAGCVPPGQPNGCRCVAAATGSGTGSSASSGGSSTSNSAGGEGDEGGGCTCGVAGRTAPTGALAAWMAVWAAAFHRVIRRRRMISLTAGRTGWRTRSR